MGRFVGHFRVAHHDHAVAVSELGMCDVSPFADDLEADLEAERLTEPVDRSVGVVVVDGTGDAGPAFGSISHGPLGIAVRRRRSPTWLAPPARWTNGLQVIKSADHRSLGWLGSCSRRSSSRAPSRS